MVNAYVLIGIVAGVFLAGIALGSMISQSYERQNVISSAPVPSPMGWIDPNLPHTWMNSMMSNPDAMGNWVRTMMQNPSFMNKLMTTMMSNPDFRQQYMGSWITATSNESMHGMINLPPAQNATFYQHMIINTNKVSIVPGSWQINTTESYHPTIISVITGTTVTWTNDDTIIHTVTDLEGTFDSDLIQPGSGWSHTFYHEGKYTYYCTIHPWMKGLVIVT